MMAVHQAAANSARAHGDRLGFDKRVRADLGLGVALLVGLAGCAHKEIDPLACDFESYVYETSTEASPFATVEFTGDFGSAPERMQVRVTNMDPDQFSIHACGMDESEREWELLGAWQGLPIPGAYPLDIEFAPGTRPAESAPTFAGSLLKCSAYDCGRVDAVAFQQHTGSTVTGTTRIENYDAEAGRFVGSITATAGSPWPQPTARIFLDLTWNAEALQPKTD